MQICVLRNKILKLLRNRKLRLQRLTECNLKNIDILTWGNKVSIMRIQTNGQEVIWQPNTGTQRNVWDESYFRQFQKLCKKVIPLKTTSIKLFAYGSKIPLPVGCFHAVLKSR